MRRVILVVVCVGGSGSSSGSVLRVVGKKGSCFCFSRSIVDWLRKVDSESSVPHERGLVVALLLLATLSSAQATENGCDIHQDTQGM